MSGPSILEEAARRDAADPLRALRARFAIPQDSHGRAQCYLAGHSLGLMPLAARAAVLQELTDWARLAVQGHERALHPWIEYHEQLTAGLTLLTGARASEVVAMNSLTVNLHLLFASFYRPTAGRNRILIEQGAFSSDRHAVVSQILWHGLDPSSALIEIAPDARSGLISEERIEECLERHGAEIALVWWPGVQFRTGEAFDLARISRAAHRAGALAGFDLAHSIGNLSLQLSAAEADFAVWCGYKYLNGGPGALAGAFVHERHTATRLPLPRLAGWWGHDSASRFGMEPGFVPMPGAAAWQVSNPPILAAAPLLASFSLFAEAGMDRIRAKSVALTGMLAELLRGLGPQITLITPSDPDRRGAQLSFRIAGPPTRGKRVYDALQARGILCDWREPELIRAAPVPLYNSFADVVRYAETLDEILRETP